MKKPLLKIFRNFVAIFFYSFFRISGELFSICLPMGVGRRFFPFGFQSQKGVKRCNLSKSFLKPKVG